MKPGNASRLYNIAFWALGALLAALAETFVEFAFGNFDPALGRVGSLQIALAFAMTVVLAGLLGYAVAASVAPEVRRAIGLHALSGALFGAIVLGIMFGLSKLFPEGVSLVVVAVIPVAFGAASFLAVKRYVG
jgi:hypothetical protein